MSRTPAVVSVTLPERVRLSETKQLPYLIVSEWDFPEDYGEFHVTADDLDAIERNHKINARRTDLPVLNEEHGHGAAGWIKDFVRVSEDRLDCIVDLNPRGEQALAGDEYRRVSPEILRDYTDAETGEHYSMVAAGLALTTAPRLKALDRIAASEARVLAFAEAPSLVGTVGSHIDGPMGRTSIEYAIPELKRLPLTTKAQVKGSIARFGKVKRGDGTQLSEEQRTAAWKKIVAAAEKFGVDVPSSFKELSPVRMAELLAEEEQAEGDGPDAADFADQDCPACGSEMDVVSVRLHCPDCGSVASFDGGVPAFAFAEISGGARDALGADSFAVPGKRKLPIHDASHVRNAIARFGATQGLTPEEKTAAKTKIRAAAKKFGIDVADDFGEKGGATFWTGQSSAAVADEEGTQTTETETASEAAASTATGTPAAEDAPQAAANMSEVNAILAAERTARQRAEAELTETKAKVQTLSETIERDRTATRLAKTADRIDSLVRAGKVTPAEAETFKEEETLVKLSENPLTLNILEQREKPVIDMSERGSTTDDGGATDDNVKLVRAAKEHMAEQKKNGRKIAMSEAIAEVARVGFRSK